MKDGRPLHWRAVQFLAGQAVAELGVHGVRTHFVLNPTTMAPGTVFWYKIPVLNRSVIQSEFFFHRHPDRNNM
jgi:hypothetical protein